MSPRPTVDVLVCRGCCCGSQKHPEVDHDAQVAALEAAVTRTAGARLRVVDCLLTCDRSNVVLVRGAARGSRPVWLGGMVTELRTKALCDWIEAGGPDAAELPLELLGLDFSPPRLASRHVPR